jgi:hypothetical protein
MQRPCVDRWMVEKATIVTSKNATCSAGRRSWRLMGGGLGEGGSNGGG